MGGGDGGRKRGILVVDDEESIRNLFDHTFRENDVVTCESAEKALEIIKDRRFDVMIIDISLPGMNGCELTGDIRDDQPDAFIIGMTGYANKFEFSVCREAGFDAYFYKPVSIKTLRKIVDDHFGGKNGVGNA